MRTRTPAILQMQAVDSGVVSLAIILEHHGRVEPIWKLREASGFDASGPTIEDLQLASERFGLECTARRVETADLATLERPVLIGWGPRRYAVLEGRDRGGWWVNDPAHGAKRISDDEFQRRFNGNVLECRPGTAFRKGGRRSSLFSNLRRLLEGSGAAITASVVASSTLVLVQLAQAGLLTYFIDVLIVERRRDRIPPFLLAAGVILALGPMLVFIQAQAANRLATFVSIRNKFRLMQHATRLPETERRLRTPADFAQRLTMVRQTASTMIAPLVMLPSSLLTIAVFGTAISIISWKVGVSILVSVAIGLIITKLVAHRLYTLSVRNQVLMGMQRSTLYSGLGVRDWLQESGGLMALLELWLGHMSEARNITQQRGGVNLLASNARNLVNTLITQIGTLVLGGLGVIYGTVTIGELAALQFLAGTLQTSVTTVLGVMQSIPTLRSNLTRIEDILEIPLSEVSLSEVSGIPETDSHSPAASGIDLSGTPIVDGGVLEGCVPAGGLAVVRDLPAARRRHVCKSIATALRARGCSVRVLTGRVDLFPGTLAENVSGFDPQLTPSTVAHALESAGLGGRLRRHPSGLAAPLREDQPFGDDSEELRLELATVLAAPPSVVVVPDRVGDLASTLDIDILSMIHGAGSAVVLLGTEADPRPDTADIFVRDIGEVAG